VEATEASVSEQVSDTTTIDASMDTVWEVITDLEAYPDWADGVLETEILSTDDEGYPDQARFRVDAKVAEVTYTLAYRYDDYDVSWELVEGETVTRLDGSYELSQVDDGTHVRYRLTVDVDLPVPGFLKKRAARTILEQGLNGLKQRAEAGG
jgi:ribosome-associated toxin RatA of RatAB toxin-antitoxin module